MGCASQQLIHLPVETSSAISSVEREIESFVNALSQTVNLELLRLDTPLFVDFFPSLCIIYSQMPSSQQELLK